MKNNELLNFKNNEINSSLILSSPHSGNFYPEDFLSLSNVELPDLNQNEDSLVDDLIDGTLDNSNIILKAVWSRSVVDVNRAINDFHHNDFDPPILDLQPSPSKYARSGIGVIPIRSGISDKMYKSKLPGSVGMKWLRLAWKNYHNTLNNLLKKTYSEFGHYVLFDFHSMPSISETTKTHADIVLGDCHGKSINPNFIDFIETQLKKNDLNIKRNSPYSGGYITKHYGKPKEGKHTIQIEINRSIYLNEKTRAKNSNFNECKKLLSELINQFEKNKLNLLN